MEGFGGKKGAKKETCTVCRLKWKGTKLLGKMDAEVLEQEKG